MDFKNQVDKMVVTEYLRTRLGNKPAVMAVADDLQVMFNRWYSWAAAERDSLRQEIEELKLELMMLENEAYEAGEQTVAALHKFKNRRKHYEQDPY
jgi:hypothetical protein